MSPRPHNRPPPPTAVASAESPEEQTARDRGTVGKVRPVGRASDWSILMARGQGGDRDAYRRLLEDIAPYLRSLAARRLWNPSDVEDAVQDVLLTIHSIRHTYDPDRPFGPWLVAIANRRIIDRGRRQARLRSRETELKPEYETFAGPLANLPEEKEEKRALRKAVEALPSGQRQAIRLLKLEEMSLREAAAASGLSVAALKVATHRALRNLRKMLARQRGGS